ncbi:CocE/NonD family hydrolase [Chitinophaga eiseniae]|nr:CocE/NonD family hydrolase [Chitinophaga eiseniae]
MRNILLGALLCLYGNIAAQSLPFPREAAVNQQLLATTMPVLAQKLLPRLQAGDDRWGYLQQLLMVQLTARQYKAALQTIREYRSAYAQSDAEKAPVRFIQYETYINALQRKEPVEKAFREAFSTSVARLQHASRYDIDNWYIADTTYLAADLQRQLAQLEGQDSIALQDAIQLCRRYAAWQLLSRISAMAAPLLRQFNRQHYDIRDSLLISTRDGASVSAIVVRPRHQQGPLPVIFFFTIYTDGGNLCIAKEAADKGYVGVVANTRGKRLSPEIAMPYEHDGNDAHDVINWISRQSWCNGSIGMYGGSYVGFTQWAAIKEGVPPALKTIVPSAAVVPGFDVPKENNVFMSFVYPWIPHVTNNQFLDNVTYNDRGRWRNMQFNWYHSGAAYQTLDSIDGTPNPIYRRWLAHPDYDAYWQNMTAYKEDFARIDIPILSTTGYFDGAQIGAMYYYREHLRYRPNAAHYLVIGPYDHLGCQHVPLPYVNGYTIDNAARISVHQLIYQWFDHILKGAPKPPILEDRINYQVMGTNQWKHVPSLQQMNNDTMTFYLSPQRLVRQPPTDTAFIPQQADLSVRSGRFTGNYILSPLSGSNINTANGLVFVSDPLPASVAVNGSFLGKLLVIPNKKDVDIGINLYEQTPDGRYFQLSYFIGRASYAASLEKRQLLTPGSVNTISFSNTRMISKQLAKGSRLVVVININQNPFEEINYGTGKKVSEETIADAGEPVQLRWRNDSYIKVGIHHQRAPAARW